MTPSGIALLVAVIAGALLLVVGIHSRLIRLKVRFESAFSQITVQLTLRHDRIVHVVEAAQTCLTQEDGTLAALIEARNSAATALQHAAAAPADTRCIAALNAAEQHLGACLRGADIQFAACPELHATPAMRRLSEEPASARSRLAFARQAFNNAVTDYNIQRNTFPANLLAPLFGHTRDAVLLAFADAANDPTAPTLAV